MHSMVYRTRTHHTLHRFSRRERTVWTRRSGTDLFETREIRDAIGASPIYRAPSCRERRARPVGRLARAQLHGALRELQVSEERLELECGRGVRAGTGLARGGGRLGRAQLLRRGGRLESTPAEERGKLRSGEPVHLLGVKGAGKGSG